MARIIEGLATSESVDSVGDVVKATGVKFRTMPFPLLGGHDHKLPIGKVIKTQIIPGVGVMIRAEFIPAGQSRLADDWFAAVRHGAAIGLSIGFMPLTSKPNKSGGKDLGTIEIHELSVVAVACNSDCVARVIEDTPTVTPATALAKPKVSSGTASPAANPALEAQKRALVAEHKREQAKKYEAKREALRKLGAKV
ncbi:UNVERIFIED_ORG: prohead serine protease [Burkholderia sp. CF145]